ncbi:MAG: hypothetical protein ACLQGU_12750 [bacterium]
MPLFQKINAVVMIFILFCACNIVYAQESNLKNPESKIGETIDFIKASSNKRQTGIEADVKSSESNISERIDFIQASFDKGRTRAELWSYTWIAINGAATGIQTYQAISSSRNRAFNIVGASESFLGLAMLIVDPFHACSSGSDLRKLPESTPEELKYKLEKAEKWLERNYKQEKLGTSWLSHVGILAISAVGGGIVWHYNGGKNGLISVLSNIAGGELFIWTQPTRGIRDYNDYHSKYKDAYDGVPEKKYFIAPSKNGFVAGMYF